MTTPPSTPAPSGGGMPKILIIVIVVVLVIIVGCCGGIEACSWLFGKGVQSVASIGQNLAQEAQKKAAEAQKKAQEAQNNPEPENSAVPAAAPAAGNSGNGSANAPAPSSPVVGTRIPANFPADIPIHDGLTCTTAFSDKIKGTGSVIFTGTGATDTLSDYYEKQMAAKGWKEQGNTAFNGNYVQSYSKEDRKATIGIVSEGAGKPTSVQITYEKN